MKQSAKYGKYFRRNMRLFTGLFVAICLAAACFYLWSMLGHQAEKVKIQYQDNAQRVASEMDNKLEGIRSLLNEISTITWVKKLSTSSDVFMAEFTALERIEYQKELSRYIAGEGSITDIAICVTDRGIVLSQKGLFSSAEYCRYLKGRIDIDPDDILAEAARKNEVDAFVSSALNLKGRQTVVVIKSLVSMASPPASLIVLINRDTFNQSVIKLGGEGVIGIEVLNADGEALFGHPPEAEGYEIDLLSSVLPIHYRITYTKPASILSQFTFVNLSFIATLFATLALAVLAAYLLSLYNILPLQRLLNSISRLTGEAQARSAKFSEFQQIEDSFTQLYAQKEDLQEDFKENYNLTRQYALMLVLSGDQKFWEWTKYFEDLDILFTEDQFYSVWIATQKQEPPEQVDYPAVFSQLLPGLVSAEEITMGPTQTMLILGRASMPGAQGAEQESEQARQLILERYGALVVFQAGEPHGPGILGISQSYHGLTASKEEKPRDSAYRKTGKELADYINGNYCSPDISLKELSDRFGLSVPTISRLCKEALGASFQEYVTRLRLEKAKALLLAGGSPSEAAEAVGYGSEYSFRRAFQRSENCRLQDWRASNTPPYTVDPSDSHSKPEGGQP